MIKPINILLLCLSFSSGFCQEFDPEHYTGFILTVNTEATRNVIGSTLNDYREIREACESCQIAFVCNESGITKEDHEWYARNVLLLKSDVNTTYAFSDSLYNRFQSAGAMEQILKMKNGRILQSETLKHYSAKAMMADEDTVLMSSAFNLFKIPRELHPGKVDIIRSYSDQHLLYLSDLDESLSLIDIETGEVIGKYKVDDDFPISFYCSVISVNDAACEYARDNRYRLHKLNRSEFYLSDVRSREGVIAISGMLQVYERLKEDFIYVNELGLSDTLAKGSLFANGYSVIIFLDDSLKFKNSRYLNDLGSEGYEFEAGSDFSFCPQDDGVVVLNLTDSPHEAETPLYSQFNLGNNGHFLFDRYFEPIYPANSQERMFELEYGGILFHDEKLLAYVDVLPFVYDLDIENPVYQLQYTDDEVACVDKFAQYYTDPNAGAVKYRILALGRLQEAYIGVIYSYCDETIMMDLLDHNYKLKQRFNLSQKIDFDPWLDSVGSNIVIVDDGVLFLTKEDGYFFIKKIPIDKIEKK